MSNQYHTTVQCKQVHIFEDMRLKLRDEVEVFGTKEVVMELLYITRPDKISAHSSQYA